MVLAVARAEEFRHRVAEALEPEFAVYPAAPRELDAAGPLLDAAACVVELDGPLEDLEPLLSLPAGRCLTLVADARDAVANMAVIDAVYEAAGLTPRGRPRGGVHSS